MSGKLERRVLTLLSSFDSEQIASSENFDFYR